MNKKYYCGGCHEEIDIEKRILDLPPSKGNHSYQDWLVTQCPLCCFENQFDWSDMNKIVEINGEKYTQRLATHEESFYSSLGDESIKQTIPSLISALRQMVTLSSAMIGLMVTFLDKKMIDKTVFFFSLGSLFMSLVIAGVSSFPFLKQIEGRNPAQIKKHYQNSVDTRVLTLKVSGLFFALGLLIVAIGILCSW
jgi:hypothetical protein